MGSAELELQRECVLPPRDLVRARNIVWVWFRVCVWVCVGWGGRMGESRWNASIPPTSSIIQLRGGPWGLPLPPLVRSLHWRWRQVFHGTFHRLSTSIHPHLTLPLQRPAAAVSSGPVNFTEWRCCEHTERTKCGAFSGVSRRPWVHISCTTGRSWNQAYTSVFKVCCVSLFYMLCKALVFVY